MIRSVRPARSSPHSPPPEIAVRIRDSAIHNQTLAHSREGKGIPEVIAWARDELEGFVR